METFSTRLIRFRGEKGWGQAELARYAQVSRGTIVAWEANPHQRHDPDKLARVAQALGKEPSDLEQVAEPEPITTPARLHSWLNQHLTAVIEAEVQRRLDEELAHYGITRPLPPEELAHVRRLLAGYVNRERTGHAQAPSGPPAEKGHKAAGGHHGTSLSASSRRS